MRSREAPSGIKIEVSIDEAIIALRRKDNGRKKDVITHDELDKEEYYKRIAICDNVVPSILRSMRILNEKNILLEEELWMNSTSRVCRVKSRNLTWSKYANMWEESSFKPSMENPHWTVFEQHGTIDIKGIGPFGRIMEVFAKQFLHAGVKRVNTVNLYTHFVLDHVINMTCSLICFWRG
ncbi:hypothetical protein FSP39_017548 [Pinctada imbricata]|uniref:PRELI/MSF1 domain-containing protein n=1 Tax=Pinctada imbricata TaxID=66713 RepID=A0AA88YWB8_PINIB|nr:hypothetical protein FSP39_017548 [Pinctada imbricata]